jgi:hypothetical protein
MLPMPDRLAQNPFLPSIAEKRVVVRLDDDNGRLRSGSLDGSGEDYLYPGQRFVAADLPIATRRAVLQAA